MAMRRQGMKTECNTHRDPEMRKHRSAKTDAKQSGMARICMGL